MSRPTQKPTSRASQPSSHPVVVSRTWLLKAIGLTILAALICAYLSLCLLFYQGQWQLVLHPQRAASIPSYGHPASILRFGPDESAIPQLTGRWIAAAPGARYANITILFLPSGDASSSQFTSTLDLLHNIGLNVFAFDYRGYGSSADTHPSQARMTQDVDTAWTYLTTTRATPSRRIIPYGIGVGASLATQLASTHSEIPALILECPKGDLLYDVLHDPRSSLLPVRLLFHENFPLAGPLAHLGTPKLLITTFGAQSKAFRTASDPKLIAELPGSFGSAYVQTLTRFLDQYVSAHPSSPSAQ